ncbi:response regulator [Anaerolineales bacterium HSG6]|nr:response regulator [Anaerolineales bacterium HSG6]MDM8531354.1 response regulator [Anaerolineales bacterium HSG25]
MAKILVVDDDQNILKLLKFSLSRAGHTPILCIDGEKGLVEAQAQKPDLVIADVMMPKMHGYQFCKKFRSLPESKNTPVIMFSARFQSIDRQTALDAGASDYLPKVISNDELLKRIDELLPQDSGEEVNGLLGFMSLRGGTGVSTLAANVSIALAGALKIQPVLVDLKPVGGHLALILGLRPTNNVSKLFAEEKLSIEQVKDYFVPHNSGIQLLASANRYNKNMLPPSTPQTAVLAQLLQDEFPFSIFDLPPTILDHGSDELLKKFTKILLVLSPDMPSLQSTVLAVQGLVQHGVTRKNILLVVNQVMPYGALPLEDIQKALRMPITATIPFEPDMTKTLNNRTPLLFSSPRSKTSSAIARLANTLRG